MASLLDSNPVLEAMYREGHVTLPDGSVVRLHSRVGPDFAEALYRRVMTERPSTVIEVGMAFGASTLAILTALAELGGERRLISVDPMQRTQWQGAGLHLVERAGLAHLHQLYEEPDYFALPAILRSGLEVDLAYIDGWHTFDYTLLDVFYIDRMLKPGGVVAFNDCHLPAVTKVLGFLTSHRHYERVDSGLSPLFGAPSGRVRRVIWMAGRRLPLGQRPNVVQRAVGSRADDQYLRKLETWEPPWDFYAEF